MDGRRCQEDGLRQEIPDGAGASKGCAAAGGGCAQDGLGAEVRADGSPASGGAAGEGGAHTKNAYLKPRPWCCQYAALELQPTVTVSEISDISGFHCRPDGLLL